MTASAQMTAHIKGDVTHFESSTRDATNAAKQMGAQISRALDGSKASARSWAGAFDQLRASIDPAFAASQRYADLQRQISGYVDAGVTSQRTANMVLEQAASKYLGIATAAERAEVAQREQAQSAMLAKQSYDALRTSLDPLYASSKRYEQAQETLTAAVAAGIIKQEEAARVLQMANQRYLAVAPAAKAATSGISKFAPAITNAGFQVQDFAVQVASGQSAMMAFAQQFPQLMGVLGFSGKLAMAGAAIGTFAAVAFAVAPMLFDIGKKAKTAEEQIDGMNSALRDAQAAVDAALMPLDKLVEKYGNLAGVVRQASINIAEQKLSEALTAIDASLKSTDNEFSYLLGSINDLEGLTAKLALPSAMQDLSNRTAALRSQFDLTEDEVRKLSVAYQALMSADGPDQQARAAAKMADALRAAYGSVSAMPADVQKLFALLNGATMPAAELDRLVRQTGISLGDTAVETSNVTSQTYDWASSMAVVNAQIQGILSSLSQIGGGLISRASKFVEMNALKAGKSIAEARIEVEKFNTAASWDQKIFASKISSGGGILGWAEQKALEAAKALDLSNIALDTNLEAQRKATAESERLAGRKGGSGASASDKVSKALDKEAQKWLDTIDPMNRYQREMSELLQLQGRLSKEDMAKAIKKLNVDLADSIPMVGDLSNAFADFVVSGGKDIEGLGDLFKGVLKQMIADAAKNQIMLALGIAPTGTAGTPGAAGGSAGGGGTLSNFGGLFAKDGWLMTGLGSGKGLLGTIGGWLGMGGQAAGAAGTAGAASGIMGSLGSLGSMMGTVGAIIGGIGMVVSLGKKLFGRELKDTGLSGVFRGSGFSGSSYKYYKGGLLRSDKTSYEALDPVVQSTIGAAYGDLRKSVKGMAGVLDLGSDAIKNFAYEFKISTKDMTEEQALQALQDEMAKAGSGMAELILGTKRYTEAGETALDTLTRLSSSLTAVRQVALLLGHTFDMVGLRGGDVASNLAKAFGGAESMGTAVQAYWQTFYTDGERIRTLTRQTSQELRKMGVSMPRTREQYRALIESLDLSDKSSHKLYATLIGLSGVMDQILPTVSNLTREMERLQGRVVTIMDKIATGLTAAIQANQAAAGEWRKAGDGIRDYLDKLRGTASALISPMQARAYNQMKWMTTLASARAGDLTAAGNLTGAAGSYLDSVNATAGTRLEAARAQARVAASLGLFANKTETQADKLDRIATIQGRQLALIERLQALMDAGKTISAEQLDLLRTQLGDLDRKILRVNVAGFEGATSLLPKGQMQGLRSALDDLRDAIRAETARQKHEAAVTKLNSFVGNLTKNKKGNVFVDDKDLSRMARIAGIDAEGLTANQLRKRLVNFDGGDLLKGTVYDPTGSKEQAYLDRLRGPGNVSGPAPQWAEGLLGFWQKIYNNPNLTVKDIMAASKGGTPLSEIPGALEVEKVKKKVKKFAAGGYHAGGLRIVGENGPEAEFTGPSRIYSASQTRNMFDMTGLTREVRAMREELVQMREENRQLGLAIADNTRKMQRIMQKWDQTAVPTQEVTP